MKKTIFYSIIALIAITGVACNDEWTGEQYRKYVSFVRSGYSETYLNSNTTDGIIHYKIPVEISGTVTNDRDVTVTIELDPDTLVEYNQEMFYRRTDRFFRLLDEQHYSFPNGKTVTIPAGENTACIDVDFKIGDLDLVEKYILPLAIVSTSEYTPSPVKWYRKTLIRVIPFNYFSGTYSSGAATIKEESDQPTSTSVATREMRVVSDSTVFFYAGLCEEDARDRATYKVRVTFNADKTLTFEADSAQIEFTAEPSTWSINEEMDALQPHLMIRTVIMDLKYSYKDVTNPYYKVKYNLVGSYTLERRRNIQIPEEDQQEIFEW
jgi:hypothetical protein